jgi:hypothetical protein
MMCACSVNPTSTSSAIDIMPPENCLLICAPPLSRLYNTLIADAAASPLLLMTPRVANVNPSHA